MFFSHVLRTTQPKNCVPRSKGVTCSPFTDRHTDGRTHRVTTKGTLSGFQDFFPSTYHQGLPQYFGHNSHMTLTQNLFLNIAYKIVCPKARLIIFRVSGVVSRVKSGLQIPPKIFFHTFNQVSYWLIHYAMYQC